jgi:hypothetical protein
VNENAYLKFSENSSSASFARIAQLYANISANIFKNLQKGYTKSSLAKNAALGQTIWRFYSQLEVNENANSNLAKIR